MFLFAKKIQFFNLKFLILCFFYSQFQLNDTFIDIRVEKLRGVSIDLALSNRGRLALRAVDLEHILVNEHGSAMKGRMLHSKNGSLKEVIYDPVQKNVSSLLFKLQN